MTNEQLKKLILECRQKMSACGDLEIIASGAAAAPQIQVVLNWFEELKARVPTK